MISLWLLFIILGTQQGRLVALINNLILGGIVKRTNVSRFGKIGDRCIYRALFLKQIYKNSEITWD